LIYFVGTMLWGFFCLTNRVALFIVETMQSGSWTVNDVFPMVQLLGCVRTDVLQVHR